MAMNHISTLPDYAFSRFEDLVELRLAHNQLKSFPPNVFTGIKALKTLNLRNNLFKKIPVAAFKTLTRLTDLHLDNNHISELPPDSFDKMTSLVRLWLDANLLTECPTASLSRIKMLQVLYLDSNQIKVLHNSAFKNLTQLISLSLNNNSLEKIEDDAFEGLNKLYLLNLDMNHLTKIPYALYSMPQLKELTFDNNRIEYIQDNAFIGNKKLAIILFGENPILSFGRIAFKNLPHLEEIKIHEARDLISFPDLRGCSNLHTINLDRASIRSIPYNLCDNVPMLKVLDVHSNQVSKIPDLSGCSQLKLLNLGNNHINDLAGEPFSGLLNMQDLILTHNDISLLPADAFKGLNSLQYLDLSNNKIGEIDEKAFAPCFALEDLNLGDNQFPKLPTEGLQKLTNLKTYNNKELKEIPPPETFPKIQFLTLSYAYHCCEFLSDVDPEAKNNNPGIIEEVVWLSSGYDPSLFHNDTNEIWDNLANMSVNYHAVEEHIWNNFATGKEIQIPGVDGGEIPTYTSDFLQEYQTPFSDTHDLVIPQPAVKCKPMPGPFMPCDDLMGWWALRCGVWIVFLFALLGNGCVLFVLISSRTKMDVPRFLICNLAVADFLMGIYLGFLAVVDASTLGEFKKHAIRWQMSPGCLVAGFLGVLSSELSVFTLTVITLERFYAITHAMHLNKRLSIRHAGYIMMCGWCFALLIASMPLFGVSDYRKFAICLPFEIGDSVSLGYVCFIMFCNMIAFIIIVSCYMKMYCSVRGSQAWNSNDSRVAKRMALLVFTDFACWAPISFFAIASALGFNLISLNDAKIFTIFILPLNSCANPFLYAIFTKQFKKDCVIICNRIEESSVARHFTRLNQRSSAGNSWVSSHRPSAMNSCMEVQRHSFAYSNSHSGVANSNSEDIVSPQACIVVHNDLASASREESSESSRSAGSFPRKLRLTLRGPKKSRTKRLKKQNNKERRNSYTAPVPNYKMDSSLEVSNASASSLLLSILQNQLTQTQQSETSQTDSEGDLRCEAKFTGRGRHRDRNGFPHFHNDDKRKRSPKSSPGCWSRRFQGSRGSGGKKTHHSNASLRAKKCRSYCPSRTTSGTSCEISSPLPSSSQSSSDNNNHEYVNITEEMISHLRDVSLSRPNLPNGNPSAELGNHGNYLQMGRVSSERKSDEEMEACNYVVFDPPLHPAAQSPEQTQDNHHSYMQMSNPSFEYVPMVALTSGCSHHSKETGRSQEQRRRQPTPEASPASVHNIPPKTRPPLSCQNSQDANFYMDGALSCGERNCSGLKPRPQSIPSSSSSTLANQKLSFGSPIATSQSQCLELHSPDVMTSSINSPHGLSCSEQSQQDSACDTYYESIRDSSSSTNSRGSCSTNASNLTTVSIDSGGDYHNASSNTKETDAFLPDQRVERSSVHVTGSHAPLLEDGALCNQRRFPFSKSVESGFNSEETVV